MSIFPGLWTSSVPSRVCIILIMSQVVDDKSKHVIPFILEQLEVHERKYSDHERVPALFIGLNGVQGSGKTTLVRDRIPLV